MISDKEYSFLIDQISKNMEGEFFKNKTLMNNVGKIFKIGEKVHYEFDYKQYNKDYNLKFNSSIKDINIKKIVDYLISLNWH